MGPFQKALTVTVAAGIIAATGGLIRSAPVELAAGSHLVWDLPTNRVHVQE